MKNTRTILLALCVAVASCLPPGANVRTSQLYVTGSPDFDAYFKDVHALQMESKSWRDDQSAARRALVDELKLGPTVADVTIVQAAHERMIAAAHECGATRLEIKDSGEADLACPNEGRASPATKQFFQAVETSVKSELARAKALRAVPPRVDKLTRSGRELDPRIPTDFSTSRSFAKNVKAELDASLGALDELSSGARAAARETEDFVADLQRGLVAEPTEPLPSGSGSTGPNLKPPPKPTAHVATAKPVDTGATPKPQPKPQPKPVDTGEVFNP
jgi:hypothetical protein